MGYSKEEVIEKHLSILLPPERFHELEEMRAKVEISGTLRDIEVRSKRKMEASSICLSRSRRSETSEGKIVASCAFKDVTEKSATSGGLRSLIK